LNLKHSDVDKWVWDCETGRRRSYTACKTDEDTGQTILSGMGELHLEIIVDRMKREFKVEINRVHAGSI
jgi:hypothetical protein